MRQYNVTHCQGNDKTDSVECIGQNARQTAMAFPSKIDKQAAQAMIRGGMSQQQVADIYQVSRQSVSALLARVEANKDITAKYRDNKAQVLETIQTELLSSVRADNPKEAQSLVTSAAILEDKIRLERGQSIVNTTVDIRMLIASLPDSAPNNT